MKSIASLQGLTQDAFHPRRIASGDLNWIYSVRPYHISREVGGRTQDLKSSPLQVNFTNPHPIFM